ncbi:MAG: hypothetical protein ABI680_15790 [Chthoniobacteraceae bacterium]
MKTTRNLRPPATTTVACLLTSMAAIGIISPIDAHNGPATAPERIGVYDSRAVAIAYAGSKFQEQRMKELKARYQKAREAGNAGEVSRLEAEGQAWQTTLHQQGFGTASVEDLLEHVCQELSKIQKIAGVTCLVSRWNTSELEKHPQAGQVDVTMLLVDAFQPSEKQRKAALEIQNQRPQNLKR